MKSPTRPRCTRCGAPLLSGTLGNRCLRCLLELGLNAGADDLTDELDEAEAFPQVAQAGQRFGDYELLEEIGRGGMGVVYRARQISLDRIVALKMLVRRPFETPELAERLEAEAKAAARLHHPGIVAIHEFGQHAGQFFFSMEYVEGRSLADVIAESPGQITDFERVARYLRDIAAAVHYAHEQGILHRDLKPSNILVEVSDTVKVTDFGLAKQIGTDSGMTLTGQVLGSPSYLSPEQAAGQHDRIGPRSDVYALGAVLFELLTGRPPFVADSFEANLIQIREKEAPLPRLLNPRVPRDLETIGLKCLEKEPDRRYASARELAEDLGRFLDREPIRARPISLPGRVWRWSRRKPAVAGLSFAVLALLLTVLIGLPIALVRISRALDRAEAEGYASRINLAQAALKDGVQGTALQLLEACLPEPGQPDRRGWEWSYLRNQCVDDSLATNQDNPEPVMSIAVSPVTNQFVVTRRQGTIELWRVDQDRLQCIKVLRPRVEGLFTFAGFCPQGDRFATCEFGALKIWRLLPAPTVVQTLTNETWAFAVAFSPDGQRIACLDRKGFRLYDLDSSARPYAEVAFRGEFFCRALAFHPHGGLLAFGDPAGMVRIVEVATGKVVREFTAHPKGVVSLAWSPEGDLLASAALGQTEPVKLWDGPSHQLRGTLEGHRDAIQTLAFVDGERLVAAGYEQSVRIWELATRECTAVLHGSGNTVFTLGVLPDRTRVVTGDWNGRVTLWPTHADARTKDPSAISDVRDFELLTEDGQQVLLERNQGRISFWQTHPPREIRSLDDTLGEGNYGVAISLEKQLAAFSNVSGRLSVWSLSSGQFITNFLYHEPAFSSPPLLFTADGNRLLALRLRPSPTRTAWRTDTWQTLAAADPLCRLLREVLEACRARTMTVGSRTVSQDGRFLFIADDDGSVHWFDLRTGERVARFREHTMSTTDVAISPDDRLVASVSTDSSIVCRDIRTRRVVRSWQANNRPIGSAAFSPDGRRVVTAFGQGYGLAIWDWATQRSLITLPCDAERIEDVQFSPNGRRLFAVGNDTLYMWDAFAGSGTSSNE